MHSGCGMLRIIMTQDFFTLSASRSGSWPLALFIALSVVVHALGLLLFPGESRDTGRSAQVRALEVVLLKPEAPPVVQQSNTPAAKPALVRSRAARKPEGITRSQSVDVPPVSMEAPRTPVSAAPQESTAPVAEHRAPTLEARAGKTSAEPLVAPSFNASNLHNPAPGYPIVARRNGEQGTVTIKVLVARDGAPANVSVDKTSGYARLDNAALETVRSWRFAPARQGAQPVEAWVLVPIVFRLEPVS